VDRKPSRHRARRVASLTLIAAAISLAAPAMASAAVHSNGIQGSGRAVVSPDGIQGTGHAVHIDGIEGTGK